MSSHEQLLLIRATIARPYNEALMKRRLLVGVAVCSAVSFALAVPMIGQNKALGMSIFSDLDVTAVKCDRVFVQASSEYLCGEYEGDAEEFMTAADYAIPRSTKLIADGVWKKNLDAAMYTRAYSLGGKTFIIQYSGMSAMLEKGFAEAIGSRPKHVPAEISLSTSDK